MTTRSNSIHTPECKLTPCPFLTISQSAGASYIRDLTNGKKEEILGETKIFTEGDLSMRTKTFTIATFLLTFSIVTYVKGSPAARTKITEGVRSYKKDVILYGNSLRFLFWNSEHLRS